MDLQHPKDVGLSLELPLDWPKTSVYIAVRFIIARHVLKMNSGRERSGEIISVSKNVIP
jgi:hypothetical protein